MNKRKIGIFGLTGDPTHDGHVYGAETAFKELRLDEVWLVPTPESAAKASQKKALTEHRLHLAHLALLSSGRLGTQFKVSDFEVSLYELTGKNATVDVLEHFTSMYQSLQPVWLMGVDNLCQLHEWGPRWTEIMTRYPVGVLSRAGWNEQALVSKAAKMFAETKLDLDKFQCQPGTWTMISDIEHSASSSEIRETLRSGQKPRHLCREAYDYIREQGLYQ